MKTKERIQTMSPMISTALADGCLALFILTPFALALCVLARVSDTPLGRRLLMSFARNVETRPVASMACFMAACFGIASVFALVL